VGVFSHLRLESPTTQLQTLRPKFRVHVAALFILLFLVLGFGALAKSGVEGAFYAGLCILTAASLIAQYRKERALVQDHQSAVGVVTEYRVRWKGAPHMRKGAPRIKYSFVAFDMRTYTGETGWGVSGLRKGTQVTILYRTSKPASSLPLRSFIF